MITHEFILLSKLPTYFNYNNYLPSEMNFVNDDFVLSNPIPFQTVKMHNEYYGNIQCGISYYGVTILDVGMSINLKESLLKNCFASNELDKFINLLDKAIIENKYILHFGV